MSKGRWLRALTGTASLCTVLAVLFLSASPAGAQNRRKAWEIFIYFGEYGSQTVPSAIQKGVVNTYRIDPFFAAISDPNAALTDPSGRFCLVCRNLGATGPGQEFLGPPGPMASQLNPTPVTYCDPMDPAELERFEASNPYLDECDDDIEAQYRYNAQGIVTNGEVQRNDSEFLLGSRVGYNIDRHWEVELDLGFAKQRLDMTKNLDPMLQVPVSNPADPYFQRLADFYVFTWANRDFTYLGYQPIYASLDPNSLTDIRGMKEIPNVPQRRASKNPSAVIPAVLPMPLANAETFEDVTAFVNRVFLDPGAIRNRANQVNIDIFSTGLSGVYNFNTKPDSRLVPYLQAGIGRWNRTFDAPYKGEATNYYSYGGGARFFVNEIFSFRAEVRNMVFRADTTRITADIPRQNLLDNGGRAGCFRDQDPPAQEPPQECPTGYLTDFSLGNKGPALPNAGTGGTATLEFITRTDNFWEARVGFDILLGGK